MKQPIDALRIARDLRDYNLWRRGEDADAGAPDPSEVGVLIDEAARALEALHERQK